MVRVGVRDQMDTSKIHLIDIKNKKFVLDINSQIFFEVDELAYALIKKLSEVSDQRMVVEALAMDYPRDEIIANLRELMRLFDRGILFSEDKFTELQTNSRSPISSICLNISHDCNLRCAYCFADREGYIHDRKLMDKEIAERSIDFLIKNSAGLKELHISFFGGEPLMNLPTLLHTVEYAEGLAAIHGKSIRFHVTTNGTLLTTDIIRFFREKDFSLILSIDGPKEVHDTMRCYANGRGSYDVVAEKLRLLLSEAYSLRNLTIRSTFTRNNLDIENLMMHLVEIGCRDISVEPAFIGIEDLDISEQDLGELLHHYDILADKYINEMVNGRFFSFFHIRQMMDQSHRRIPRLAQCGASSGYLAISPEGKIYPCHMFVGMKEFEMGDVYKGITNNEVNYIFSHADVRYKKKCRDCWARYVCGGGCHYHAIIYNKDILNPYDIECEMIKKRIELGIYSYCTLREMNPSMYKTLYGSSTIQ